MANDNKKGAGWIGVIVAVILGWNGCAFVSDTASVYEDTEFVTMYDNRGQEHILESPAGHYPRPNKNKNVPLGAGLIIGAVVAGLWGICQFE